MILPSNMVFKLTRNKQSIYKFTIKQQVSNVKVNLISVKKLLFQNVTSYRQKWNLKKTIG